MKIGGRFIVRLYPRAWRNRYGDEFVELLSDRVRPRDVVFQTFVPATVSALRGQHLLGTSTFGGSVLFGLFTGFVWSSAALGPVAFLCALIPWREIPFARPAAMLMASLIAFKIARHAAWGPVVLVIVIASLWIGYRSASIAPKAALQRGELFE